jgi:transposase
MARAHELEKRLSFVKLLQTGQSLLKISQSLQISYDTAWRWSKQYQKDNLKSLQPGYETCGNRNKKISERIRRSALWLKRLHRNWGATYIWVILHKRYPQEALGSARQLGRYFAQAGFSKISSKKPKATKDWARQVHECWQVDAKEQQHLADGQQICWLTFTDERTSATFAAEAFPPQPHQSGAALPATAGGASGFGASGLTPGYAL